MGLLPQGLVKTDSRRAPRTLLFLYECETETSFLRFLILIRAPTAFHSVSSLTETEDPGTNTFFPSLASRTNH